MLNYGVRIANPEEPIPQDHVIIQTPYSFFNGLGKVIRKLPPHKNGTEALIQLPKNDKESRKLAAKLAVDALLRDTIIKELIKQNKRLVTQLESLGEEVKEYQEEIVKLDEQIESLSR